MAEIASLHGTTPAEIFQSGLHNLSEIEAVAVGVSWKDGRVTAGWSNVDAGRLALMLVALDEKLRANIFRASGS